MTLTRGELESQGFRLMFTATEPRLSEHVEEYEELGYEVQLVPLAADDMPDASCSTCLDGGRVSAIYVRRRDG